ncbi:MAG: hypothetical protein CVU57_21090 [Deltaproteobacteria bacterium HGW-Deltaproteobacteria-15]|nr:MAG: hypothetical protein CVU57_21090 [Deltaproteobacteria bacterium HGW-Deltaproteobacteria-15]
MFRVQCSGFRVQRTIRFLPRPSPESTGGRNENGAQRNLFPQPDRCLKEVQTVLRIYLSLRSDKAD